MTKAEFIGRLNRTLGRAAVISLALFQKEMALATSMTGYIASTIQPRNLDKWELEWSELFAVMQKWKGERSSQEVFAEKLEVESEGYHVTFKVDQRALSQNGEAAMPISEQRIAQAAAQAYAVGTTNELYEHIATNDISYDGQPLIDDGHVHPNETQFSNLLDFGFRADNAAPTMEEAAKELRFGMRMLSRNRIKNLRLYETTGERMTLVITHSEAVWSAYQELAEEDEFGNTRKNRFKGKFKVARGVDAVPSDDVEIIDLTPGSPKPALYSWVLKPGGMEYDQGQLFRSQFIDVGSHGYLAKGVGFPQALMGYKAAA